MAIKCAVCPLRPKKIFSPMSADEVSFMERFKVGELTVDPGTPVLMEGANSPQIFTLLSGLGVRFKTLENGRRQVLNFAFPGDFLGLQAGILGEMKHSVEATTTVTLCVFKRSELFSMFRTMPERAFDLTWAVAVEESFLGEALATIGQKSAAERIAWALVKIFRRGDAVGMTSGNTMPLPFRQQDLADALGLSLVHTNKTLGRLRERQLVNWSDGILRMSDLNSLARIGGVDPLATTIRPLI